MLDVMPGRACIMQPGYWLPGIASHSTPRLCFLLGLRHSWVVPATDGEQPFVFLLGRRPRLR